MNIKPLVLTKRVNVLLSAKLHKEVSKKAKTLNIGLPEAVRRAMLLWAQQQELFAEEESKS